MSSEWTLTRVYKDKMMAKFDDIDTEKNGTLRFREVVQSLAKAGWRGNYQETKKLFSDLDVNDDKVISRPEFVKAIETFGPKQVKVMALRSQFVLMDADKSGSLTNEEVMDATKILELGMEADKISNLIIGLVKDNDGKLNYEEFLTLYNKTD